MSEQLPPLPGSAGPLRTLAVRMSDDLRAQLDVIAQLNDRTVTEEIRIALEAWIERSKNDPTVLARAETVRAEIEREAQTRRNAIEAIFAQGAAPKTRASKREEASS
jgi:predicted transcriptional regulator